LIAYSNAEVWDSTYKLIADTLFYFSESDSGSANGNTTLKQKNQIVTGDKIEYKKYPGSSGVSYSAKGNVTINESGRIATS
jgi:lipopolysaccharide export system protein LptA